MSGCLIGSTADPSRFGRRCGPAGRMHRRTRRTSDENLPISMFLGFRCTPPGPHSITFRGTASPHKTAGVSRATGCNLPDKLKFVLFQPKNAPKRPKKVTNCNQFGLITNFMDFPQTENPFFAEKSGKNGLLKEMTNGFHICLYNLNKSTI